MQLANSHLLQEMGKAPRTNIKHHQFLKEVSVVKQLDVRPILNNGGEPFDDIMKFVGELQPGESFELLATFRPDPLLQVLKAQGFKGEARERGANFWSVMFTPANT